MYKAVEKILPDESLIYFGDSAHVPYGTKSANAVRTFSEQITSFLIGKGVKLIIVACNTASSVALDHLRRQFSIPIFGVVEPAVKKALAVTRTGTIGVIGTRATINSGSYEEQLRKIAPNVQILSQACPLFVSLVEEGWQDTSIAFDTAMKYLAEIHDSKMDTLILGCTHYPVMAGTIQKVVTDSVRLITSGEAVAEQVKAYLKENKLRTQSSTREESFFVTDLPQQFDALGSRFLGRPIKNIQHLPQL